MKKSFARISLALVATSSLFLAGCAPQAAEEAVESDLPTIVVTTNMWADVVEQVVGEEYDVITLITDPAQDPHSYEATARDQLAIEEAELVVVNGGGYDDFALTLAEVAGTEVFNIYELHEAAHTDEAVAEEDYDHAEEGEEHDHEHSHDGSDHIWYDAHVARHSAKLLVERLGELNPESLDVMQANWEVFAAATEELEARIAALADPSVSYFEAHPMATLLLAELGYQNLTPEGFAEGEESGLEPSVTNLAAANDLIDGKKISFLAVNSQVTSPTLDALGKRTSDLGIPTVAFDELLPEGKNYQEWMGSILDALEAATAK